MPRRRRLVLGGALLLCTLGADSGRAQTITNLTISRNGGNSPDGLNTGASYQNKTTVGIESSSATGFTTRYAEIVGADTDSGPPASRSNSQSTNYTVQFDVTAPGVYFLTVQTLVSGALTLVNDNNGNATADMTAIGGSQTGGILSSGSLNLPAPGTATGTTDADVSFTPSATARIDGTSNGVPVTHKLTFTWTASCTSTGGLPVTGGNECAVRLGLPTEYTSDTAGDYPGPGNRDAAADGHFVTVALSSLCGNGILDPGEDCDDGGTADGDCCSAACAFESSTTVCRPAAGPCDVAEQCTGTTGACPGDAFQPTTVECRAAAGACDVAETCSGTGAGCPADGKSTAVCRASAGPCDPAESCDGSGDGCPADTLAPPSQVCRAAAGPCDAVELCTGASTFCPPDQKSLAVCRSSAGICDVAESCDGVNDACPTDVFQSAATLCRVAAGACDLAEYCTGSSAPCPADVKSTAVCRPPVGPCDAAESCDGVGDACPADALAPATRVCRPAAAACDAPELCTGSGTECPPDGIEPSGFACRPAAGDCDVAETCTGASTTCPPDDRAPAGTVCRAAADACDVAESCDGTSADCPAEIGEHDTDGDGICDSVDTCATTADPEQLDVDGDGIGDACDPCTNVFPTVLTKARLVVSGLLTPPGDDRFSFKAGMRLPVPLSPPVDPMNKGVRLLLAAASGTQILDAALPGGRYAPAAGAGWKAMGGRAWLYRNNGLGSPTIKGIRRLTLRLGVSRARATIRVAISGRDGSYPVDLHDMPIKATLVIDTPVARRGQCGEGAFTLPACRYDAGAGRLRCRG